MSNGVRERSEEYALAALLLGVGEFGHRAHAVTSVQSLEHFLADDLRWLAADASGRRASEIALASYHSNEGGGRLRATGPTRLGSVAYSQLPISDQPSASPRATGSSQSSD
jgi:hypothetical protein